MEEEKKNIVEEESQGKRATISSKKVGEKRVTKKRKIKVVRK